MGYRNCMGRWCSSEDWPPCSSQNNSPCCSLICVRQVSSHRVTNDVVPSECFCFLVQGIFQSRNVNCAAILLSQKLGGKSNPKAQLYRDSSWIGVCVLT